MKINYLIYGLDDLLKTRMYLGVRLKHAVTLDECKQIDDEIKIVESEIKRRLT